MNQTNQPNNPSGVPWPTSDERVWTPDGSTSPRGENAALAAAGVLTQAVQGARDGIDRFADDAAPAMQRLGENVSAAGDAMHEKADQLRETKDEWVEGVRSTVRGNPLVSVAAAIALGAVIARVTR